MRSMADCATGTAAGLGTERGAGSSLSSSSSGSERERSKILSVYDEPAGDCALRILWCLFELFEQIQV